MTQREAEDDNGAKVHDIKFDEYGIMDDGVDESTDAQLAKLNSHAGNTSHPFKFGPAIVQGGGDFYIQGPLVLR